MNHPQTQAIQPDDSIALQNAKTMAASALAGGSTFTPTRILQMERAIVALRDVYPLCREAQDLLFQVQTTYRTAHPVKDPKWMMNAR